MTRHLHALAVLIIALPILAGCATGTDAAGQSPTPSPSKSVTTSPTPTPTPTAAVTPEPVVSLAPEASEPAVPVVPPAAVDPNSVDPADYVSTAIDDVNGGIPLPGVAFTVADGAITCGILTSGHEPSIPGFVSCTPDTYRELIPQPAPEGPLFVKSIESDPRTGPAGLYPDWFKQPIREVPALPEGKNIRFEGTVCYAEASGVRCVHESNGKGFFVALDSYTYFN